MLEVEYLACIGWSPDDCEKNFFELPQEVGLTTQEYCDLIGNMAGNAWSAYTYAAVQMALMATSGKYVVATLGVDAPDDGDHGVSEGVGDEGDVLPSSADSSGSSVRSDSE